MKFKVKDVDIATGSGFVVLINEKDANFLDVHHMDRVIVRKGKKSCVAIVDIGESERIVKQGIVGVFEEVLDALKLKNNNFVDVSIAKKPESVNYIKKKLDGKELSYEETLEIIKDIVDDKLTSIELTSYVSANYAKGMTQKEITDLTKAITITGTILKVPKGTIADFHSIGGVPGNRTTMIVVPIILSAGIKMPKTSSRAITSPAGTADTMEVFCSVTLPIEKLEKILKTVGGFIVWGGSVNLAPADDKIIKIEHPLSIDAEGQMLASIMAKKASVGATHLLMEIPIGDGSKVKNKKEAQHLREHFERLGGELGINVCVVITDGSQPIGNGIGPVLEAKDILMVLKNDPEAPEDLREKSLQMAAQLLEHTGCCKCEEGLKVATEILNSGSAYKKFEEMVKSQEGKISQKFELGKYYYNVKSNKSGIVKEINNLAIAKTARIAGAPIDIESGIYLNIHKKDVVKKGDVLLTIYAKSKEKLNFAIEIWNGINGITIK